MHIFLCLLTKVKTENCKSYRKPKSSRFKSCYMNFSCNNKDYINKCVRQPFAWNSMLKSVNLLQTGLKKPKTRCFKN